MMVERSTAEGQFIEVAELSVGGCSCAVPEFSLDFLRASADCIQLLGPDGSITFTNDRCPAIRAGDRNVPATGRPLWELWPEDQAGGFRDAVARAARGACVRLEATRPDGAGALGRWDVIVTPIDGPEGAPNLLMAVSRNVGAGPALV